MTIGLMKSNIGVILILCIPGLLHAASFDCAMASTSVEKLICSDHELSSLDDQLAIFYKQAHKVTRDKEAFQKEQLKWLAARDTCKSTSCIRDSYVLRIAQIESGKIVTTEVKTEEIKQVLIGVELAPNHSDPAAHAGRYELAKYIPTGIYEDKSPVYPENMELCKAYEANLNSFPEIKEPFACERPINPKLGFSKPKWKELDPAKHIDLFEKMERADPNYKYLRWKGDTSEAIEKKVANNMEYIKAAIAKGLIQLKLAELDVAPFPPKANQESDRVPEKVLRVERGDEKCDPTDDKWRRSPPVREYFIVNEDLTNVENFSTSNTMDVFLFKGKVYFDVFYNTYGVDSVPGIDGPNKQHRYEVRVEKPYGNGVVPICRYLYIEIE